MIRESKRVTKSRFGYSLKDQAQKLYGKGEKKSVRFHSLLLVQRSNFESSAQTKKPHLVGAMSVQFQCFKKRERERERETADKCVLSVMEQHALVQ